MWFGSWTNNVSRDTILNDSIRHIFSTSIALSHAKSLQQPRVSTVGLWLAPQHGNALWTMLGHETPTRLQTWRSPYLFILLQHVDIASGWAHEWQVETPSLQPEGQCYITQPLSDVKVKKDWTDALPVYPILRTGPYMRKDGHFLIKNTGIRRAKKRAKFKFLY